MDGCIDEECVSLCCRRSSFWLLPRELRCFVLQQLQRVVSDNWQGKFAIDAKLEALGRARVNVLRLKAAAAGAAEDEYLAPPGAAAASAAADSRTEKVCSR